MAGGAPSDSVLLFLWDLMRWSVEEDTALVPTSDACLPRALSPCCVVRARVRDMQGVCFPVQLEPSPESEGESKASVHTVSFPFSTVGSKYQQNFSIFLVEPSELNEQQMKILTLRINGLRRGCKSTLITAILSSSTELC